MLLDNLNQLDNPHTTGFQVSDHSEFVIQEQRQSAVINSNGCGVLLVLATAINAVRAGKFARLC